MSVAFIFMRANFVCVQNLFNYLREAHIWKFVTKDNKVIWTVTGVKNSKGHNIEGTLMIFKRRAITARDLNSGVSARPAPECREYYVPNLCGRDAYLIRNNFRKLKSCLKQQKEQATTHFQSPFSRRGCRAGRQCVDGTRRCRMAHPSESCQRQRSAIRRNQTSW